MDPEKRAKRIEALEAIQARALDMVDKGKDATEVRDFIDRGKVELAYELPDEEAAAKAFDAVKRYRDSREA